MDTEVLRKGMLKGGKIDGYEARWFKKEDEGKIVDYILKQDNHRYEGLSNFSGKIYHYDYVAYPAFIINI